MLLKDYRPRSMLVTKQTLISRPRFPVVDAHNHLAEKFGHPWEKRPVPELLDRLDEVNVRVYVDLDGGFGEDLLYRHLDYFKAAAPDRFLVFGGVDWDAWPEQGNKFGEWAAAKLRQQAARGADGLKVWKPFGLKVRDQDGKLVKVDDDRLIPLWETAGELGLPITMHLADPVAFFQPLDEHNERWDELSEHMDWHFPSPPYPPHQSIINGLARLVERHPNTVFISAHIASNVENLAWVGELLDRCPNFNMDMSAQLGGLGRQPYSARKFFVKYADRILFGSDWGPNLDVYRLHFRLLETDDEYFNYSPEEIPSEGRWYVYGLYLPDDVLAKVYYQNAERLILNRRKSSEAMR